MKIQPTADPSISAAQAQAVGRVASESRETAAVHGVEATGSVASATVTLSTAASTLMSGADPTFDAEKVARIKQSIADGSYVVNPEAIADKLIANAREVISGKPE